MIDLFNIVVCRKFWTTSYFLDNVDYVDIYIFLDMIELFLIFKYSNFEGI
jgi:hypothetical protein